MDIGINLATSADSWKIVRRAEELGYSRVWFFDTHMLNADVFVGMTAAAMMTAKIRLGTGVLIPSNRIAPVAANALASVNALAPGRIDFGISTGSTARSTMGLGPVKLAAMAEYIRVVQALLRGETIEWEFEEARRKIRFLNPEIGAINITDPIPLHISAAGPRARKLTAELGADWIVPTGSVAGAARAIGEMQKAWQAAGRDPKDHIATAVVGGCVLAEGEAYDSPRVKAQAGPHAMIALHNQVEAAEAGFTRPPMPAHLQPLLEEYRALYMTYQPPDARYLTNHRGHLMFVKPEEAPLCTAELIKAMTFTGTKEALREQFRDLRGAGFDHFSITIRHGHPEMLEEWIEVFAGI
ncbi:MAG TPA: LLM class flavin-dependent oxidoreductase [Stellaceae bacterium]|jgi:5,10-methylenetetrahydromethanopterin reductase|nr:LLM class flavin-dependent oxidoreductase [Stellaceae bacterium]